MRVRLSAAAFALAFLLIGATGWAADRHVHFRVPPPVGEKIASMPQIIDPVDDAETRVNAALTRLDETVREAAGGCTSFDGKPGSWERTIEVPMRGPGYVSFVITDNTYCGGAYPDVSTMSIVYDLRAGAPVDWTRLLPASLTGTLALQEGADGTKMVTLASKRLFELYLAGYRAGDKSADARECKQVIQDSAGDNPPPMMVWLDAKVGGLAVQFELPHAVQVCEETVVVPLTTIRAEGAQSILVDAIQKAQQQ